MARRARRAGAVAAAAALAAVAACGLPPTASSTEPQQRLVGQHADASPVKSHREGNAHRTVAARAASNRSVFGIGAYYPPGAGQLAAAADLVGVGGWVLILVPCGNVTADTPLPPACPGFDAAAEIRAAHAAGLNVVVRLEPLYSADGASGCFGGGGKWVLPDHSQAWAGHLRATADPGSNHTSYKAVAASYARVANSLPRPPGGGALRVQIGNELNIAWSCACGPGTVCMSMLAVAAEVGSFVRDAAEAIAAVPNVSVAVAPVAPIGPSARSCCANASECRRAGGTPAQCACSGSGSLSLSSLGFERMLVDAVPDAYDRAEWFSSHAYPCAPPGCGLGGDPRKGTNGWNAPFDVALPWLTVYRNETAVVGRPSMPVIVTETGWCLDFCTEADRANWTVSAWQVWQSDKQLMAVCPFLLEGAQWWPKGFPWIAKDGVTRLPLFNATVALRCELLPETCARQP